MQHKINLNFGILIFWLLIFGCQKSNEIDYNSLPTTTSWGIMAVIEVPAGTNRKIEFNYDRSRFEIDVEDGKERVIDFLPYPGNYGFIPSTMMDEEKGGDGDALDILVIGESMLTGDTISVIPIGVLMLEDSGERDTKIIAVPANHAKQIIQAIDYQTFTIKYNPVKKIIENWFLNYKGLGVMKMIGWKNDRYALMEIKKWSK